jgi:hypothetical protein
MTIAPKSTLNDVVFQLRRGEDDTPKPKVRLTVPQIDMSFALAVVGKATAPRAALIG